MSLLDIRVCPACGAPAGAQPACGHCGRELAGHDDLPTRAEWEHEHPPALPERGESLFAPSSPEGKPTFKSRRFPEYDGRPLANGVRRLGAAIIDAASTLAAAALVAHIAERVGVGVDTSFLLLVGSLALFWLLNTVVLVAATGGKSLGKLVGGMRIVRDDGRPATAWPGFLRDTIVRFMYVFPLMFLIDSLWIAGTKRQTLRDVIAGTHVVQDPNYGRRAWAVAAGAVAALVLAYVLVNAPSPA